MNTQLLPIGGRILFLGLRDGQFLVVFVANSILVVNDAQTLGKAVRACFAFVALACALIFVVKSHGVVVNDVLLGFGLPGWLSFAVPGLTLSTFVGGLFGLFELILQTRDLLIT